MDDDKPIDVLTELDSLRRRSSELIAEVERINRRINELSASVGSSHRGPTQAPITDTWVDDELPEDPSS
jgi:hypothetical protein